MAGGKVFRSVYTYMYTYSKIPEQSVVEGALQSRRQSTVNLRVVLSKSGPSVNISPIAYIGATFLSVSGAEIYSPYEGDSEKAIVELFR